MFTIRQAIATASAALLLLGAALASACGDGDDRVVVTASEGAFVPVIETSDIYVGMPRFVVTLLERDTQPDFSDDAAFLARFFAPTAEGGLRFHSEAPLDTILVDELRYLITRGPPFDEAGQWALAVTVELADGTAESSPRLPFIVNGSPRGLVAGDDAPRIDTPTVRDGILERLAAQTRDDSSLYERSAADLLDAGEPFLIVWASADRCAGRLACSRALAQAVQLRDAAVISVIHVEPFGRPRSGELQTLIDAANEAWVIEAEPQLFIVDADGVIRARFEIVISDEELRQAVDAVR